jgi:gluconokinase
MVIIVMGAAGAGKTTVGRALAQELGWPFVDADQYHSAANVLKIGHGDGLTDADRHEWLRRLRAEVARAIERRQHMVMACSALKGLYRETLRAGLARVRFAYLKADPDLLRQRVASRRGHFAGPAIVDSQLRDLEEPPDALVLDASLPPAALVAEIRQNFGV